MPGHRAVKNYQQLYFIFTKFLKMNRVISKREVDIYLTVRSYLQQIPAKLRKIHCVIEQIVARILQPLRVKRI
jgi:hypothetical protein